MRKKLLSAILALLLILSLVACGGKAPASPQAPDDPQQSVDPATPGQPGKPVKPIGPRQDDGSYTLPMPPEENRNIPDGSNVVQVGDKWIVAANIDADYYVDTSFRQIYFYVLSREPMDPLSFDVQIEEESVSFRCFANDYSDAEFSPILYYGYAGVDWMAYYQHETAMEDYQKRRLAGEDVSAPDPAQWGDMGAMAAPAQWFFINGNAQSHVYSLGLLLEKYPEEAVIHSVTVSWPGVEQKIDIGEIRLHPESLLAQYDWPDDFGLHGVTACSGSESSIFGPELACSLTGEMTCDKEIIFKGVRSLNENYPVVDVVVEGTAPGVQDSVSLSPDHPVVVSPGAKTVLYIYFTGPHLSELSVMGQGYFVIDCEVDGQDYHFIWEGGQQRGAIPQELYAVAMDNVDMQGYYEYVVYDPNRDSIYGTGKAYDELGWTEKWEAMMAEN